MKYYIIAGEASGDLHGSNLMKALYKKDKSAEVRFWGGDLMQAQGGTLVKHYKELAFMGFVEVVAHLSTILNNLRFCKKDIVAFQPDVLLFIDYPGFNMRIAKWAKAKGFDTHYYISPQIWAWKESRIKAIKRDINQLYVILPFEKDFYQNKHQHKVHYVGHPLLDAIEHYKKNPTEDYRAQANLDNRPIVALLPGSRKQEIEKMLHLMLGVAENYPQFQFVIAAAPNQPKKMYQEILKSSTNVSVVYNQTYSILNEAFAALVTSGTATLETALFKVPQVVLYKTSEITYQIAKRFVDLKFISLVNLILDKLSVAELIQKDCNLEAINKEFEKVINNTKRAQILEDYNNLQQILGYSGASERLVNILIESKKGS